MNQDDDIIRMAREACPYTTDEMRGAFYEGFLKGTVAEREKVAVWMIQRSYATGHGDTIEDLLVELEWQVKRVQRCVSWLRARKNT